jgi:hypothetical protein
LPQPNSNGDTGKSDANGHSHGDYHATYNGYTYRDSHSDNHTTSIAYAYGDRDRDNYTEAYADAEAAAHAVSTAYAAVTASE